MDTDTVELQKYVARIDSQMNVSDSDNDDSSLIAVTKDAERYLARTEELEQTNATLLE